MVRHTFLLVIATLLVCACDHSSFPAGPNEEVYHYDTVFIPELKIPTISVRTAVNIGKQLADQEETSQTYYIAGIVKSFDKKHQEGMTSSFGNAVFYMCDHLSSGVTFEGYQVMSINKAKFDSLAQIQIGDTVVVCSRITRYKKTIETPGRSVAYLYWTSNLSAYPPKAITYIAEDFANGLGAWSIQSKQDAGFDVWKQFVGKSGATSAMAWGTNAEGQKKASEVWLISPIFDITAQHPKNPKLEFQTYYYCDKDAAVAPQDMFQLKISTNDGKDWIDMPSLTFNKGTSPMSVNNTIDISACVSASMRIAFIYKSTETFAPKWNISDLKITDIKQVR